MNALLVTGAGDARVRGVLARGERVDNLNDYYDPALKHARLARLAPASGLRFRADGRRRHRPRCWRCSPRRLRRRGAPGRAGRRALLADQPARLCAGQPGRLPQHAGRLPPPAARTWCTPAAPACTAATRKMPFAEDDPVDHPVSLYAATKKANELMAHSYSHLYGLPTTGLRFFTVYGPWGRPDMAYCSPAPSWPASRSRCSTTGGACRARLHLHRRHRAARRADHLRRRVAPAGRDRRDAPVHAAGRGPAALRALVSRLPRPGGAAGARGLRGAGGKAAPAVPSVRAKAPSGGGAFPPAGAEARRSLAVFPMESTTWPCLARGMGLAPGRPVPRHATGRRRGDRPHRAALTCRRDRPHPQTPPGAPP
jgi:hypothetical protein